MNKRELFQNLAKHHIAPSVHENSSASNRVIAEKIIDERQISAHTRGSLHPVQPTLNTKTTVRDDGKNRRKTENPACIQSSTTQSEANSTTTKPLKTITVGQRQFLTSSGVNPSGALDVLQFGRRPRQQLRSQEPNTASNAEEDFYIRSSVPKLKLSDFSGNLLEWPEWWQLFPATIHTANMDESLKMNHSKKMVTGNAKGANAGLGYTAEMYNVAFNVLVCTFGKPQRVVNAQRKRSYSFPPMKFDEVAALIKVCEQSV